MKKGFISPIIAILVGIIIAGIIGFAFYIGRSSEPVSTNSVSQTPTSSNCSSADISGYSIANALDASDQSTLPAQFQADLRGDGQKEFVNVYNQSINTTLRRSLPVIVKVFSGTKDCLKEEFSYDGKSSGPDRSGNELYDANVLPNLWGDGKDTVMVINKSTIYASDYSVSMNLITFKGGHYTTVNGPQFDSLSFYKFNGQKNKGDKILIAKGIWNAGEPHYGAHKFQFSEFDWDGNQYNVKSLGTSVNKYEIPDSNPNSLIDTIIQKEPNVLVPA